MDTRKLTDSIIRTILFVPGTILIGTLTFLPKIFHKPVHAQSCGGGCNPGPICTYPCGPCSQNRDGAFTCGS
jgi:hypothetical protein